MGAPRFTEADVTRAVKGVEKCGLTVQRILIGREGEIEIVVGGQQVRAVSDLDLIDWRKTK